MATPLLRGRLAEAIHAGQTRLLGQEDAPVKARVTVMLKDGVLDPQGRAIGHALTNLGFPGIGEVRAGKIIELDLDEPDLVAAKTQAEAMARKLLANLVIERFSVEILPT